jgi:hypothetical protein
VALGAQHVQATGGHDLLGLLGAQLLPALEGVVPGGGVLVGVRLEPALAQLGRREELGVAAEQDVGMPRRRSICERISEFSTLTVPTRTGWPAVWRSTMSSTTALNLACCVL